MWTNTFTSSDYNPDRAASEAAKDANAWWRKQAEDNTLIWQGRERARVAMSVHGTSEPGGNDGPDRTWYTVFLIYTGTVGTSGIFPSDEELTG